MNPVGAGPPGKERPPAAPPQTGPQVAPPTKRNRSQHKLAEANGASEAATRAARRALTMGNAAGPLKDRRDDLHETPEVAVEALLSAEKLPHHLLEPCCGPNDRIGAVLRDHGHEVTSYDLVRDRVDFLMEWRAPKGVEAIVTNPPFKLAAQFVRHGLLLVPMVVVLERLNFIEAAGRADIIDGGKLARVHVFADRLPMMHRGAWAGKRLDKSPTAYAWLVFRNDHQGPTTLDRIWCHPPAARALDGFASTAQAKATDLPHKRGEDDAKTQ